MTKLVFFESAVDVRTELNLLTAGIKQFFPEEELKHVRDLQKFVLKKEDGSVALNLSNLLVRAHLEL